MSAWAVHLEPPGQPGMGGRHLRLPPLSPSLDPGLRHTDCISEIADCPRQGPAGDQPHPPVLQTRKQRPREETRGEVSSAVQEPSSALGLFQDLRFDSPEQPGRFMGALH